MNKIPLKQIDTTEPNNKIRIEYMVGNYCNFKCEYCSPHANGGTHSWYNNTDVLVDRFIHLLDFYLSNGRNDIELNLLGGEPTLWPDIGKFCKALKSRYKKLKITLTTNGSRTLRWWEQNINYFDKVLFSYHQGQTSLQHYIEVLDFVYEKNVAMNCLVMMDPNRWIECIESIDEMKNTSKHSWFICAMEVHPPNYSNEQKDYLKNHIKRYPPLYKLIKHEWKNVIKGKPKVTFEDGKIKKVDRNWISLNDYNHFEGWYCNIGIENINIQKDGKITGVCGNLVYNENFFYNIYDDNFIQEFNPRLIPTICTKDSCWCQPEMLMTKWKS